MVLNGDREMRFAANLGVRRAPSDRNHYDDDYDDQHVDRFVIVRGDVSVPFNCIPMVVYIM